MGLRSVSASFDAETDIGDPSYICAGIYLDVNDRVLNQTLITTFLLRFDGSTWALDVLGLDSRP